jgi:ligand-binding sensor domain-containing protein/serine phosphatase RsbU (regulator of sigma subunit)
MVLLCHIFCVIVLCFGVIPTFSQQLGKESFDRLTVEDGLSQNSVNCIFQDSKGFIWIGTQDGLDRYDGYAFKTYKHNPKKNNTISDNFVWSIFEDKQKKLWIGTQHGLNCLDPITGKIQRFYNLPNNTNSIAHNKIYALGEDKNENLWIGTEEGLTIYDKIKKSFSHYTFTYSSSFNSAVQAVFRDKNGVMYVGTMGAGLQVFDPKTKTFALHPAYLPTMKNDFIRCIYQDKQEQIWIGTAQGIRKIELQTNKLTQYLHNPNEESLTDNNVTSIVEDNSETIWIGTLGGGLNRFTPKGYQSDEYEITQYITDFYNAQSLALNNIGGLLLDKSGILWVGTLGGGVSVHDYGKEKFKVHRLSAYQNTSINNNTIWTIYGDTDNIIWLGTGGGGLNRFSAKDGHYTYYTTENSNISDNHVISLFQSQTDANRLWIGTDHGLNELNKKTGKFKVYTANQNDSTQLSDTHINSIFEANGYLWIGTSEGGLNRLDLKTNKIKVYKNDINSPHSLSDNAVECLIVDKLGFVWCGTIGGGLNKFDSKTEKFTVYKNKVEDSTSISNNIVKCIYEDKQSNLWIGTNNGLNFFNRNSNIFVQYTTRDGLPSNTIQAIEQDDNENLWISTTKGIAKFNPNKKIALYYDQLDNLQGDIFNPDASYKSLAGEMFFGGIAGFNSFFPESIDQNEYIPSTEITDLFIEGKSILTDSTQYNKQLPGIFKGIETLITDYTNNSLTFEFVSLSFRHAAKNLYECKLEGFDDEWIKLQDKHSYSYKNLPAGNYVFKVRGSNNDGVWSKKVASIKIKVQPPLWETWWFRLAMFSILLGLVYMIYKYRIKRIEAQKQRLEETIEERTAEIRLVNTELQYKQAEVYAQKQDLERQKDGLLEANKIITEKTENIINSLRYAEKIQKIILPSQQFLNDMIPEHFIIFRPKDIVSGDFYWCRQIGDKIFVSVNDCTGHGVPGAFMSMIGTTLLNEITGQKNIHNPALILEELHIGVRMAFKQEDNVNDDGIDACLCLLEKTETHYQLTFSGAKRPLMVVSNTKIHIKNTQNSIDKQNLNDITQIQDFEADICEISGRCLYEIKGDRKSIGGRQKEKRRTFTNHAIQLVKDDMIYLTSDGFGDQQNEQNEKFGTGLLKQLLLDIAPFPMPTQKAMLIKTLENHQQNAPQRDDVAVMGIRM